MSNSSPIDQGVVVITGASAGIGRALAVEISPRAKVLVLVARRRPRLDELAGELSSARPELALQVVECDLSNQAARSEAIARIVGDHGAVDVLVNNAGVGYQALFERGDYSAYENILRTNVEAPLHLMYRLLPGMIERGRGGILNIGSGAGLTPMPGNAVYAASKHFLHGLSTTLYLELEGTGVRLTEVLPGPVDTEFDQVSGIGQEGGGMPHWLRVSAEACARAAVSAFDRSELVCYPGLPYRALMTARSALPMRAQLAMMRSRARRMRASGRRET